MSTVMISFRLSSETYGKLLARANSLGLKPALLAREFVLESLNLNRTPERGVSSEEVALIGAKIARTIIIALSRDLDEDATDRFIAEVYFEGALPDNGGAG
jgi:hypothetical protein